MFPGANITHLASAGNDQVVAKSKAILRRVIFGADVASGDVTIADSATSGSTPVKAQFTGSTLMTANGGGVDFNAVFANGITISSTNQTKITVIWEPVV